MATNRMCPHSITLYNYLGEDQDGHAQYNSTYLDCVHVNLKEGITSTNAAEDATHVHIFDDLVIALPPSGIVLDRSLFNLSPYNLQRALKTPQGEKPFVPYDEWKGTTNKEQYWTLNPQGGDYFALGDHRQNGTGLPSNITTYKVTKIARFDMGSQRMHHWRIEAR
ncbi:MAG: hypothetical protein IKO94_01180 [Selenomonadaceae bacterium]|nr:hypothetical protein [Clostridia bacterium]MBR4694676.1 hypothetical protein [Selenomonadaceae bacterium]